MDGFKPVNYELIFEPDLEKFTFECEERIKFKILKHTNKIVLNATDLKIKSCFVEWRNEKLVPRKFVLDEKKEQLIISLGQKISGDAELFIDFAGDLSDKLSGFYRSRYFDKEKEKYLATTHFEPADARRAFPCWDEPEAKATFDITVIVEKNLTAISNMPAKQTKTAKGKKIFVFERTPVMSTYLAYVGVGELEFLQDKLDKILIRVVTTPGRKNEGKVALEFAKKFLKYYEDYFRIKYPLPKLDLIALPDFPEGAMENWGAITFRESELLFDQKVSGAVTKQAIAEVIAHEFVHMWFGDLVTMRWWNDLWLNESFATFMAYKSIDNFYPEFDMWSHFMTRWTVPGFELDALKSSHPIEVKVNSPQEVGEIFDAISYAKGASILRMLENYLGPENFRNGLNKYLTGHKYQNATTDDLWTSLSKASKKQVKKIMDPWVKQQGYPIVAVEKTGSHFNLSQKRFLLEPEPDDSLWPIPISVKDGMNIRKFVFDRREMAEDFIEPKLNVDQTGFYRVKYSHELLEKMRHLVATKRLDKLDRFGIENDLFQLCIADEVHPDEYLNFVSSYRNEDEFLVLSDIAGNLSLLYFLTFGLEYQKKVVEFSKTFFRKIYNKYGWNPKEGEKFTDPMLRSMAIGALGKFGDENILKTAKDKFDEFLKNPDSLNPDLRSTIYRLVAWQGDAETYKQLVSLYKKSRNQDEQTKFLISLGNFKDEKILNEFLKFSMTKNVRAQDLYVPPAVVGGNPYGKHLVLPWLRKNWKTFEKMYAGGSLSRLRNIIKSLDGLSEMKDEKQVKEFLRKNLVKGTEMSIAQTLETIRINAKFLEKLSK